MARIVLIDDDIDFLTLVATVLRAEGHEVLTADGGAEGLRLAREAAPDLVVTDVIMPTVDGWTVARLLRMSPVTADVPIIFLTTLTSRESLLNGFKLGIDDFVPKPLEVETLPRRVERVLGRRAASMPLAGSLGTVGIAPLLSMLEMERKTGVLDLKRSGSTAAIALASGVVELAEMRGRPDKSTTDVVAALLTWTTGSFTFSEDDPPGPRASRPPPPFHSTTALIMEAARRTDEVTRDDLQIVGPPSSRNPSIADDIDW